MFAMYMDIKIAIHMYGLGCQVWMLSNNLLEMSIVLGCPMMRTMGDVS